MIYIDDKLGIIRVMKKGKYKKVFLYLSKILSKLYENWLREGWLSNRTLFDLH